MVPCWDFVFMHDGYPIAQGKFLDESDAQILPWSGNNPDLNPMENLWAIVKRTLEKTTITSKPQLIVILICFCNHHEKVKKTASTSQQV